MMKMKYFHSLFCSVLVVFCLLFHSSCSDSFLSEVPEDNLAADEFISNTVQATEALNGAYDALSYESFLGGGSWIISELGGDHIGAFNNGDWLAHYTYTTDIFLGTTRDLMHNGGKAIARSNFLLDNLDNVTDLTEDNRKWLTAQCKFIRAISNFELVRHFAQPYGYYPDNTQPGIPLRTAYTIEPVNRASVKAVYDQMISDLNEAYNLLPAADPLYATKWSAKAYLAKVYFQMNLFNEAYSAADEVINFSGALFDPDLTNRFSQSGTTESIFQLRSSGLNDNAGKKLRDEFRVDASTGIPAILISQALYNKATAEEGDLRGSLWLEPLEIAAGGTLAICNKFQLDNAINVPLAHLTELKLIRAESAAETGNNLSTAIGDINDIRARAGLSGIAEGTSALQIIEAARRERELEMMMEGNHFWELKRQAVRGNSTLTIKGSPWNCNGMVWQLPDNELAGNPDMEPNPEGGCN